MNNSISACIIAKNEGHRIGTLLNSINDIVDEIIIVDTGSTDNTKEKVQSFDKVKLYEQEWEYDFSKARNLSFEKATCDWIMWLDADDKFVKEDIEKFKVLKEEILPDSNIDVYSIWYNYRHNDKGECTYRFLRERLIRNGKGFYWDYPVHELLVTWGNKASTDITITHTSNHDNGQKYIDFFDYKMKNQGYKLRQRDMYYYGGELSIFGYKDKSQKVFEKFFSLGEHDNPYESKRAAEYLLDIYMEKDMWNEALDTALKYIKYGQPDPRIYRKLGTINDKLGRKEHARFYFQSVLKMKDYFPVEGGVVNDYSDDEFISALQLEMIAYYTDKNLLLAKEYHLMTKKMRPNDPTVISNDQCYKNV